MPKTFSQLARKWEGRPSERIYIDAEMGLSFSKLDMKVKSDYDVQVEFFGLPYGAELEPLIWLASLQPSQTLDVGAGSGRISLWWQQQGLNIVGCEPDLDNVEIAQQRGVQNIFPTRVEDLSGEFDVVLFFGGGFPLRNAHNVSAQLSKFLYELCLKLHSKGILLTDSLEYRLSKYREVKDYLVSRINFYTDSDLIQTANEYYIYPANHFLKKIMTKLGFESVKEWELEIPMIEPLDGIHRRVWNAWEKKL